MQPGRYARHVSSKDHLDDGLRALIDDVRDDCLWFLRPDYYPETDAERRTVLDYIERYGNLHAFRRARALR